MTGQIALRCPSCNKRAYDERRDGDPVQAMEAVIICPDCDDGDFHEMRFLTAAGKELLPDPALKTAAGKE